MEIHNKFFFYFDLELNSSVRRILFATMDISGKLGNFHEVPYSRHYETYITSIVELYTSLMEYLEEQDGVKTPTNIKSFESLTSAYSDGYDEKDEDTHYNTEYTAHFETSNIKSVPVSPNDEVSFISTYTQCPQSSSELTKVSLKYAYKIYKNDV